MEKTLGTMPREYREAFELHRFYNKSYKEIADIKNVSPKTIDYRIQQALRSLRVSLKDYVKKKWSNFFLARSYRKNLKSCIVLYVI